MLHRDARSTPNISYKINSRGPVCLVACRDARLALMITRALEEQHYPLVLVPSALGFRQPLLLEPDVVILDEWMAHDLDAIGSRETMHAISQKPMLLLGADPAADFDHEWFRPLATLPLSSSSTDIVQMASMLAQGELSDGRQLPAPTHGQGFNLTLPVPAVS
jgi:hypothetical protein